MEMVLQAKKRFIRKAAIGGVLSLCTLIAAVMMDGAVTDLEQKVMIMRAQMAGMQAARTQAVEWYNKGVENQKKLAEINPSKDPLYGTLDRQSATTLLDTLNQKYQLTALNLNISPATLKIDPPFQRKSGGLQVSGVTITFSSITDEFAYGFLRDIITSFPGFVHLTAASFTKKDVIGEDILYAVHNGEVPPKVEASVTFDWIGLEIKEEQNAAATPQP
jgi:hypothetical protein